MEEMELEKIVEPIIAWYVENKRMLPWRKEKNPYSIWVSEIMLQQTRIEAVKAYYERFMKEVPNVEKLAKIEEAKLLKLWEGLGYYNRVRNMQAAARQVMEDYGGKIPSEYKELLKLKGIGHYTAGAIASIAYGVAGDDRDIMKQQVRTNMEIELKKIIPRDRAGAFNQALMELGATICVPNGKPLCGDCPWKEICVAKKEGLTALLPVKRKPAKRRLEKRTVLLIQDGERLLIRKRPERGLLAGMYEFPNELGYMDIKSVVSYVKEQGLKPLYVEPVLDSKHVFSHVEWHMKGYLVRVEPVDGVDMGRVFAEVLDLKERYAVPAAFAAYMQYLDIWPKKG